MDQAWTPPQQIDEFRVERRLGRGGMGDVWLARDTLLERDVALKFAIEAASDEARLRFLVEARAVARLQHPNILAVHHAGELADRPFLVTELLRGTSLDRLERPPPERVVAIGADLARALTAAHATGVIHRDVKPANAFLCEDGAAKLLDFGLAQVREGPAIVAMAETLAVADDSSGSPIALDSTQAGPSGDEGTAGTPLFMAPETWRGQAATRKTDVYSLGALLFTLLANRPPYGGDTIQELRGAVLAGHVPDLAAAAPEAPASLVDLVVRCLNVRPEARPLAEEVCNALEAMLAPGSDAGADEPQEDPGANPYRGLLSFGSEHRHLFFGREVETAAVLTELRGASFVLVVGASGAGKSSLVRAGVLPRVLAGALGLGEWHAATMVPGERPIERLAQALAPSLGAPEDEVAAGLAASPAWAAQRIAERGEPVLLFVDQFEEAWTLSTGPERAALFAALAAFTRVGPAARVVATLRADFLSKMKDLGELRSLALRAPVMLGPLSSDGLRRAIDLPARRRGVEVEPELVERLVEAARGASGMLPLLEFALGALWDKRDRAAGRITATNLDALGGLEGALAAHADGALARLAPRLRTEARRLLLALVTVERTRARREEHDLVGDSPEARAALGALIDARLVMASAGEETTAYEVAHEVLLSGWPTLRAWLDEESSARQALEHARRGAAEWERLGRGADALFGERQLDELDALGGRALPTAIAEFVAESRAAVRRARARRFALRVGGAVGALLVAAAVGGGIRWSERRQADAFVSARLAEADPAMREVRALDAQVEAARSDAFARYDAGDTPGGESRWREALALARSESDAFAAASAPLGLALGRDPLDPGARARAADLAYFWLLAAERDHEPNVARDLGARLAQLDDDGSRRAHLAAPAHMRVTTMPPGASVLLHGIRVDADGRRVEDEGRVIDLGASLELAPGSYVLDASAPGRHSTRLPVLLRRAQDEHLEIPLPSALAVPPGFVFVPAGTSLLGAADVEGVRAALLAEPEHPVQVDAFLIGEHEVTYAEYLDFLASLPAAERASRRPHASDLDLTYDRAGAPSLTLGTTTVKRGDPLCRPKRSVRRCQDWLRFPVAGISREDARAYVAWLARARVPGARLCSEREWERAARGADGRLFPGGDLLHPGDANFDATYGLDDDQTGADEVGSFPADRSPFGALDLGGNVSEWVEGARAARGGYWHIQVFLARTANRGSHSHGDARSVRVGVRVCVAASRTP